MSRSETILEKVPDLGLRLERQTAPQLIAGKLKTLIATNMLQAGDSLPSERELANVLQVSRETVRGAIQILAAQGFIEVSQGSRSRVLPVDLSRMPVAIAFSRPIDSYDLDTVHAARLQVELHVVDEAARRIDEAALAQLDLLMESQRQAEADVPRFLICDREFHVTIYRACGNPLLADFVTDLYTYMIDYRRQAMSQPGATRASYADHDAVLAALKARDHDAVVTTFRRHLTRIYETTRDILQRAVGDVAQQGKNAQEVQ